MTDDAASPADRLEPTTERAAERRLERITFDYSATEDRLLARMQASDGERQAAWLTQRLARRLVKALLSHLEKAIVAECSGSGKLDTTSTGTAGQSPKAMLMSFRHQAAQLKRNASPAVAPIETRDLPLLEAIHARLSYNRAALTMELPGGPAVLSLSHDHAWQLLQILLNIFRKADWPVDVWPDWMRDQDDAGTLSGDTQVLH